MKSIKMLCTAGLALLSITTLYAQDSSLTKVWETDSTLKVPESVLFHGAEQVLYVSCIDGKPHEKDLKGSIARVSPDGKILNPAWVTNLSAPKGMGIYKGDLYVADLSEVVIIQLKSGKIKKRIPVQGSVFLNDITIDDRGNVFVSDSRTGKVHLIQKGNVSTWLENKPGVNGLLAVENGVYLAVKDTLFHADASKKLTPVTTGMDQSSDGIVKNGDEIIVSCWNGVIYAVKPDGSKNILLDTRPQKSNTADIGFDPETRMLYVPTFFKNKVVAYRVE